MWWKNKLRDGIKERQGQCTEARSDGGFDRTCTYSRVPGLGEQRGEKRGKRTMNVRGQEKGKEQQSKENQQPETWRAARERREERPSLECNHNRFASNHKDEDDSSRRHKNICLESQQERRE